jgi:two-component system, NarL family, sensor histidine kinase UhpB
MRARSTGRAGSDGRFLFAAVVFDIIAGMDWSYVAAQPGAQFGSSADALYMLNYSCAIAAFGCFYASAGGSLLRPRVWLDIAVLMLACAAAMLPFLFAPLLDAKPATASSVAATFGYAIGIGATSTLALLTIMQVSAWREERSTALLVVGVLTASASALLGIAANERGFFELGNFDDLGCCIVFGCYASAAVADERRQNRSAQRRVGTGDYYNFLPVIALLCSVGVVIGAEARRTGFSLVAAGVLLMVASALLIARQIAVRAEMRRLTAAAMTREIESRLTELVRRSADVIAVVNREGKLSFVSPAAAALLGIAPDTAIGAAAADLLGAENRLRLGEFLEQFEASEEPLREIEFACASAQGQPRLLQVVASNQVRNPLLAGIILTVRNVTAERAAERELLEAACRERHRLSSELHEGLGQDLTGISMLVQSLASAVKRGEPDAARMFDEVSSLVRRTISFTRDLASWFSPIEVSSGSLSLALERLAADASTRWGIEVFSHSQPAEIIVPEFTAEHLYRIVYEAIVNASRHSGCSYVGVELRRNPEGLTISVADDRDAAAAAAGAADGLAIPMINHRIRLLGGTLRLETPAGGGALLLIEIPAPARSGSAATPDQTKIHDQHAGEYQQGSGRESQIDPVSE